MLAAETARVPFDFPLSRPGDSHRPGGTSLKTASITDPGAATRPDLVGLAQEILESAGERQPQVHPPRRPLPTTAIIMDPPEEPQQQQQQQQQQPPPPPQQQPSRPPPPPQPAGTSPESPTARFTAVNGRDANPPASASANGHGVSRPPEDRANGQRATPPGPAPEKLKINTSTTRDWSPPPNASGRPPYTASAAYVDHLMHKRKRSSSLERGAYHSHALPSASTTKQTPLTATTPYTATETETPQTAQSQDYGPDDRYRPADAGPDDGREGPAEGDLWHSRAYSSHHVHSDEHLGEVLQRASQHMDAHGPGYGPGSPGDDDRSPPYARYDDGREMSASSDPKKRKRNFSNRTKTGCMTCRRRKKKCDENRPECNNCLRGGFVCSGYQQRGPWPKPDQKQGPVPLQSKSDYESLAYAQASAYTPQHLAHQRREPLPGYRGSTLRVDPPHGRPIGLDDEQQSATTIPSASVASPENNRLSAISYVQQTPTPVSASSGHPDRQLKGAYDRLGPLHEPHARPDARPDPEMGTPQSASSTLPQILHPPMHAESPRNPQVAAQLALSNLAASNNSGGSPSTNNSNRPRTQKEEMLAGRQYFPFDKELVLERERCNGACWRFNNSTNPNNGVSPEERSRLFRDILQPRENVISPTQASPIAPLGRVGDNVVVEAPFNCDYGYNISIGQDVAIGKNCTILDTCEVKIGDRCNIGPNVNIYTATLPVDPKRRLGSRGPNLGRKITIDSDCWIGGGVTILPGRTIGKGSTVGAGSIVTRDVPPYTVVCGNPARVIRGLYPPQHD